jgi:hypothetical protein
MNDAKVYWDGCASGNDLCGGAGFDRKSSMEATLETRAETILEFVHGLRGSLRVSFEEGTCAAW